MSRLRTRRDEALERLAACRPFVAASLCESDADAETPSASVQVGGSTRLTSCPGRSTGRPRQSMCPQGPGRRCPGMGQRVRTDQKAHPRGLGCQHGRAASQRLGETGRGERRGNLPMRSCGRWETSHGRLVDREGQLLDGAASSSLATYTRKWKRGTRACAWRACDPSTTRTAAAR